ncbi:hypothetical protein [Pseudoalteromonas sp. PS5]|uniref:DUF6998 domain-containing protein n=1 Tax=Pseudoalteromonas sp. PS5 TaxID=1437473 RepID=UPI000FFE8AC3|nr:hypothetical protein [Pseudoalteromonas sp. PS5]RXE95555.1 hypothetical protein D9603_20080 [Pseudoalteromonas sp. PS5]
MDLKELSIKELLLLQSSVINELKRRKVVRTKNNPLGDYAEWLAAKGLGLDLAVNSSAGYDGIDSEGVKVQVKGRRITPENKSRQLSAIRKLEEREFDLLAAIVFDKDYEVIDALLIPHEVVCEYASYKKYVNAHILQLRGAILKDSRVRCIKKLLVN